MYSMCDILDPASTSEAGKGKQLHWLLAVEWDKKSRLKKIYACLLIRQVQLHWCNFLDLSRRREK